MKFFQLTTLFLSFLSFLPLPPFSPDSLRPNPASAPPPWSAPRPPSSPSSRPQRQTPRPSTSRGAGIARQRQAIIAGLRESIKDFSSDVDGVSSRDVITLMITNQYLDAIQNMAQSGSASTIFLPHSPGAVSDLGAQIRDAFVQGSAVASAVSAVPGEQRMGR